MNNAKIILIWNAQLFENEMHEPRWAYQQELNILKERGLFAFYFVAIKLAYPCHNEYYKRYYPERGLHGSL